MRTTSWFLVSLLLVILLGWTLAMVSRDENGSAPGHVTTNQPTTDARADLDRGTGVRAQQAAEPHGRVLDTVADSKANNDHPSVGSSLPAEGSPVSTQEVASVEHYAMNDDAIATARPYERGLRLNFRGKNLVGADFRGDDMTNADLRGANLTDADFSGANLSGANLEEAVFDSTNLHRANLRDASLSGVEIDGINMASVDFSRADLRGARLSCDGCGLRSDARGANFAGADLRGLDFGRTVIHQASLDGADLRGANMALAHGTPRSMRGALYDKNTRFPPPIRPEAQKMSLVEADTPNDGSASP